jgi:hypothetical protein
LLEGSQPDPHYHLLQDVVVTVVLQPCPFPLLELLLELEVESECFGIDLMQIRQKILAKVFVVVVQRFEGEDARNNEEDIGVGAFHHFPKAVVLLRDTLDGPREVQQMAFLLAIAEIVPALLPTALVLH